MPEYMYLMILLAGLMLLVLAQGMYIMTLRDLIFRIDKKLAEHLENDPRYVHVTPESRSLAKRLGVDLLVKE